MNAPAPIAEQIIAMAETQLTAWGVTVEEVNEDLLAYASNIVALNDTRIGDIVVQFGFATKDEVERYISTKPANVFVLEHLSECIDNLRLHTQKLLAANDKLAYYESLENAPICEDLRSNAELLLFCQEHKCLPIICNTDTALRLVFADYPAQKEYAQRARIQRANDAISQLQQTYGFTTIIFGIAKREQIDAQLHSKSTDAVEATDDEDRVNIWFEKNAATPNQKLLTRILTTAVDKKSSNIQFKPNPNGTVDVYYRRHGKLRPIPNIRPLSPAQMDEIKRFLHIKAIARHTDTGDRVQGRLLGTADGQFIYRTSSSQTNLRCSFIPAANDGLAHALESISMRLLPRDAVSIRLADKNISPTLITVMHNHLMQTHGLILLVGQTGSGKSTTVAGAVSLYIDINGDTKHLLSLEQPVEQQLVGITQINTTQRKFESNMAALLRHDPDFIWVGEIRDRPSAAACIRAANTGHMVCSTLHSDDAPTAYNALLSYINNTTSVNADSVIVTQYDAISALSLVIAQRLLPTLCPHCKMPIAGSAKTLANRTSEYTDYCTRKGYEPHKIDHTFIRNPEGCKECDWEGYAGEVPINEILPVTDALRQQLTDMANDGRNDLSILASQRTMTLYNEAMRVVLEGQMIDGERCYVAINDALI